jgi:hypothetical protein
MSSILSDETTNQMSYGKKPTVREQAVGREHEEAVKRHSVELYLLNELPEEERARFEEHYFDCAACADAVEAGQEFITKVRPVVTVAKPLWQQPAAAIAALFLAVAGGQQFVIATLRAPQANTIIMARELEKNGDAEKPQLLRTPSATIEVNLSAAAEYPFYLVKIAGGEDKRISQIVPAPANSESSLSVQVSRKDLGAGKFKVDIMGLKAGNLSDGQKIGEEYEFEVK